LKKYPYLPLKEASIRRFKNLYQSEMKKRFTETSTSSTTTVPAAAAEFQELPRMKSGRPLLLPERLDTLVQEYIKELRKCGATVSAMVVATARGIIMNKDANLLYSNGGGIKLTDEWAKSLLR